MVAHKKKNVPVHKYVRVKIVAPDLRVSTKFHITEHILNYPACNVLNFVVLVCLYRSQVLQIGNVIPSDGLSIIRDSTSSTSANLVIFSI